MGYLRCLQGIGSGIEYPPEPPMNLDPADGRPVQMVLDLERLAREKPKAAWYDPGRRDMWRFGALMPLDINDPADAAHVVALGEGHTPLLDYGDHPVAAAAGLTLAASSYVYAWAIAGNPVLPLFNGVFQSPYFGAFNLADARWHAGFDALLGWRMTFQTSRYREAWNGGMGFVLVALGGAALVAVWRQPSRALALVALAALTVPLAGMQ